MVARVEIQYCGGELVCCALRIRPGKIKSELVSMRKLTLSHTQDEGTGGTSVS